MVRYLPYIALLWCAAVQASDIKVVGGSAVTPVMDVLVPQFEQSSGHKVRSDFDAAVGAVATRIEKGEHADVVIVSRAQADRLERAGKVVAGTRADLAKVGVGVFVRKGAPRPEIGSVEAFRRTMLAAKSIGYNDPAAGAPVSIYLIGVFDRLGIGDAMQAKTVVFKQRGERFAAVARGDVAIGFNQISEIVAVPEVDLVGPLPAAIQNYTQFTVAVVASSREAEAAKQFIRFITSATAQALMRARGFE